VEKKGFTVLMTDKYLPSQAREPGFNISREEGGDRVRDGRTHYLCLLNEEVCTCTTGGLKNARALMRFNLTQSYP
jgi:hypothetical protein